MAKQPRKIEDAQELILAAMRRGVLVHSGVSMIIGGEKKKFQPGDVIKLSPSDLQDPATNPIVNAVGMGIRGTKTGKPLGNQRFSIYESPEALKKAHEALNERIMAGRMNAAAQRVDDALARLTSQGRKITSPAALDRLLAVTLGDSPREIVGVIREGLIEEFGLDAQTA